MCALQLKVLAEDGGTPPNRATATVTIQVQRNLNKPKFNPERYEVEVLETMLVGDPVVKVTAEDADRVVGNIYIFINKANVI